MADRPTASTITDDQLEALYTELADATDAVKEAREVAERARTEVKYAQKVMQLAAARAERAEQQLANARAECDALQLEVHGLNPYALAGRRDAVARIRTRLDGTERYVRSLNREQVRSAVRDAARTDPDWFRDVVREMGRIDPAWFHDQIRRMARIEGTAL